MKTIKALLLAALAITALAALPAAAAASGGVDLSLQGGTSETGDARLAAADYAVQIEGEVFDLELEGWSPGQAFTLEVDGESGECEDATYDGGEAGSALFEFALDASPTGCEFSGYAAQVEMNSCQYAFTELQKSGGSYTSTSAIACDEGDAIAVEIGSGLCQIDIPAQTVSNSANLVTPAVESFAGKVGAPIVTSSLQYSVEGSFCYLVGLEPGSGEDGDLESHIAMYGTEGEGPGLGAEDLGLEGGTPGTGDPRLVAGDYPVQIEGEVFDLELEGWDRGDAFTLEVGGQSGECEDATYDGGEASRSLFELALDASPTGCEFGGYAAQVEMNSCQYGFTDLQKSGGYTSTSAIACDEGDAIAVEIGSGLCQIDIPAQTVSNSANLVTPAVESFAGKVGAPIVTSSLQYSVEGSFCELVGIEVGSGEDGDLEAHIAMYGVWPS